MRQRAVNNLEAGSVCSCDNGKFRGHDETTHEEKLNMIRDLYSLGWGYHKIGDFAGISHEIVRDVLLGMPVT